ncbi:hypothetical protein NX059_004941 [Plenodomus lindquistii]|nr:hypothetical protein NX059_004941 [Plenodomus lindquistii]
MPLRVPLFSTEELPLKEPAPLQSYSIGEEISNSASISIAWSSSGLAKHRTCALAVLTSNLVLSVWSPEGKPQDEASWNRRLIVNDSLRRYFLTHTADHSHHALPLEEEKLRLRSRVRAFTWAPPLPNRDPACVVGTRLSYGPHVVAVSNDDNRVIFVTIRSPTSTNGLSTGWSAEVFTHFSVTPSPEGIVSGPVVFEDMVEQQRYIPYLAWSPWIERKGYHQSVVVYSTNHDVRARVVKFVQGTMELCDEILYPNVEPKLNGPMRWSPIVEDGDKLKLALFTATGLVCLTISADDGSVISTLSHDLDARWDEISGAFWDVAQQPKPKLHVSSLASTLKNPTAVLEVSSTGLVRSGFPMWRDQIEDNLALFSMKNDLKGNCRARVWGLTLSPLGDFVAACHSVHPSDMIEYGPPGDRRGIVTISTLKKYLDLREAFTLWDVSAESVLFSTKKLAQNAVEDSEQMSEFAQEMVEKLLQTHNSPQDTDSSTDLSTLNTSPSSLVALIEAFKRAAFLQENSLRDRYTILINRACGNASPEELPRTLIAYRLASTLQHLPSTLSQTPFSAEIRLHHQQVVSLIDALTSDQVATASPESQEEANNQELAAATTNVIATDVCDFCSAPIPFSDLGFAACTNGHGFPRCGLSFLAIQAPGITKYCGICSTPFLNEEFVAAQDVIDTEKPDATRGDAAVHTGVDARAETNFNRQEEVTGTAGEDMNQRGDNVEDGGAGNEDIQQLQRDNGESEEQTATSVHRKGLPVTLARVLFLACDACIYCGGKFVG